MALRFPRKLSARSRRRFDWALYAALFPGLLVVSACGLWSAAGALHESWMVKHMTGKTRCIVMKVDRVDTFLLGGTRAQMDCRYVVAGRTYREDFPLPRFSTDEVERTRRIAQDIADTGDLDVYYDPADPNRAALTNRPGWFWSVAMLLVSLFAGAWAIHAGRKSYWILRVLGFVEDAMESADEREAERKAREQKEQESEKEKEKEAGRPELTSVSTRNHLPARPPPGWSVPMASKEGRGAWMIETPGVLVIAKLVRVDRGRVKLQVAIIPEDRRRLEDPQALSLLRHFRAVDEFVEDADGTAELARESPWVRVFLATPRAASPETWGEVKQAPELLN